MVDADEMSDAEYDAMVEQFVFGPQWEPLPVLTKAALAGGAVAAVLLGAWSFL